MEGANTQNIDGLVLPAASSDAGNSQTPASGSASEAVVRQRKRRSDADKPRGPRDAKDAGGVQAVPSTALSQQQFAALYSPQLWEKAICAPADALAAVTGRAHWEVSEKERVAVGASCSIAAQCFAVSDPRWLAASLALVTVLNMYGTRLVLEIADRKRISAEREAKKKEVQGFKQQD